MMTYEERVDILRSYDNIVVSKDDLMTELGQRRLSLIRDIFEGQLTKHELYDKYNITRKTVNRWIDKYLKEEDREPKVDETVAAVLDSINLSDSINSTNGSLVDKDTATAIKNMLVSMADPIVDKITHKLTETVSQMFENNSDNIRNDVTTTLSSNMSKFMNGVVAGLKNELKSSKSSSSSSINKGVLSNSFIKAVLTYDEAKNVNLFFMKTLKHLYRKEPDMWKLLKDELASRNDDKATIYKLVMKLVELRHKDPESDSDCFIQFLKDINMELELDTYANNYLKY